MSWANRADMPTQIKICGLQDEAGVDAAARAGAMHAAEQADQENGDVASVRQEGNLPLPPGSRPAGRSYKGNRPESRQHLVERSLGARDQ